MGTMIYSNDVTYSAWLTLFAVCISESVDQRDMTVKMLIMTYDGRRTMSYPASQVSPQVNVYLQWWHYPLLPVAASWAAHLCARTYVSVSDGSHPSSPFLVQVHHSSIIPLSTHDCRRWCCFRGRNSNWIAAADENEFLSQKSENERKLSKTEPSPCVYLLKASNSFIFSHV